MQYDHQNRLRYLRIEKNTQETLKQVFPVLQTQLPMILEQFYGHILQWPELQAKFSNPMAVNRAKTAQGEHWKAMFSGQFDDTYLEKVSKIGKVHEQKAIEPQYYMGGYCFVLTMITQTLCEHYAKGKNSTQQLTDSINAILKSIFLDMDMALAVYNDAVKQTANQHLATSLEGVLDNV
jgi:hemoglobin-like flavoprotein